VAAVFYALSLPLITRHVLLYGNPAWLTSMQFITCGLLCMGMALIVEPVSLSEIVKAWPELLIVGVVSKGVAYFLMASAQQHTSAAATSILSSSEAIFGAIFAAMLLGERMAPIALTGAAFIILSILLLNVLPQGWTRRRVFVGSEVLAAPRE
jgi:drug/metabolite transporter (DMT)-like permease